MPQEKRQSFMKGAAILTASTLLVKLLGLLFSIPLANLIAPASMSYFYNAYDIFAVFFMLSTAGLPVAVSRMVGAASAVGRHREADRVFSVALRLFFGVGLFGTLAMFFGARWLSETFFYSPGSTAAVRALAPTLFCISIMAAYRGYFQGRSNMVPTGVSQTIEAVTKVVVGVGLAVYFLRTLPPGIGDDRAAVGAVIGVSVSSALGMLYLIAYKLRKDRRPAGPSEEVSASRRELLITLLKFAVPITLGSCFLSILDLADSSVLMHRLQTSAGFSTLAAEAMKGNLGHARKFFDLPGAFIIPISTSLLPVLSGAVAAGDREGVDRIGFTSLKVTFLIAIPSALGMCVFARPICDLLLAGKPEAARGAAPLLAALSLAIAFNAALYTTNAILQAFGKPLTPVLNMAVGGVVKILISTALTGVPSINVMGSAISTVVSYLLIMVLNFLAIRRILPGVLRGLARTAAVLLGSAVVMSLGSYGFWRLAQRFFPSRLTVVPAILLAVVIYAVCVVKSRAVRYEDVILLPKGETLARLLRIKKTESGNEEGGTTP